MLSWRTMRSAVPVLAALAAGVSLAAMRQASPQTAPAKPAASGQSATGTGTPVIRTSTRLVQVSVIAHDKHGNPMEGLTQEDFRVYDNGQEQRIEFFAKESEHVLAANPARLPAGTWTNRAALRGGLPVNLTMILFDNLNTAFLDQSYARQETIRFLNQIRPEDRVALYSLGRDLRILHDFTNDSASLLRVLSRLKGYKGPETPAAPEGTPSIAPFQDPEGPNLNDPLFRYLSGRDPVSQQFDIFVRIQRTLAALSALAAHVASLPGRKSLLWVSGAFPISFNRATNAPDESSTGLSREVFVEQLKKLAQTLTDANVAVYPVDARGLTITPFRADIETMEDLASRTGGVAFHDRNDIDGAIREAVEDSRLVYTLAFMPTHNDWRGEFRKIKVEVRQPDLRLRFRSGYFALPDVPISASQQRQLQTEAQWSPMESTEIALTLHAERAESNGKAQIKYALVVEPQGLHFTEAGNRQRADLILTVSQKADDGRIVRDETKDLGFRLEEAKYQAVLSAGLRLAGAKELEPTATNVRFVLLDKATGRMGSVDVPVKELVEAPAGAAGLATEQKQKP